MLLYNTRKTVKINSKSKEPDYKFKPELNQNSLKMLEGKLKTIQENEKSLPDRLMNY